MRIGARALYDYAARSDKELSFNRGDALEVITKTPDNNWWDGFHAGRRGFIPVAYVEITELKTSPSPPVVADLPASGPSPSSLLGPAPPERKSSMPNTAEMDHSSKISETPRQPSILEEAGVEEVEAGKCRHDIVSPESESTSEEILNEGTGDSFPSFSVSTENKEEEPVVEVKSPTEVTSPTTNFPVKSVRSLTKQFQEPEASSTQQQQQRVLVEPHTHRRMGSDQSKAIPDPKEAFVPRSASSGNKVSMLSSTFESKSAAQAPPPVRPKPPLAHPSPISPAGGVGEGGGVFPLMSHSTPSVSPLQIAAHQSQHTGPKPPILGKKPPQAVARTAKVKTGSVKVKKKDSLKEDKKDKGAKPLPNPKPGFVASPAEIQAELQARAKRRQSEDTK